MFSDYDYIKYFLQIQKVEMTMRDKFLDYFWAVDDRELKKFFYDLYREETAHCKIVADMLRTFGFKEKARSRPSEPAGV